MGCNAIDPIRAARNQVRVAPPRSNASHLGSWGLGREGTKTLQCSATSRRADGAERPRRVTLMGSRC